VKSELIARQSRRPSGWLGEIVARVMALETRPANRIALEELAVRTDEAVLEVGCGHGRTLTRLAELPCAFASGIDPSEVMVRLARRRARRWIEAGRADVCLASSARIPHADARFDAAMAMHVIYFWSEPVTDLREIRRVLRPAGRLLLGYRPRDEQTLAGLPASVYVLRSVADVESLLAEAGFEAVRSTQRAIAGSRFAYTQARRPLHAEDPR
jgi:SAM-dependent methyltransferase